ncbi:hypothetical protein PDPE_1-01549 [Photobacterium damselae subsp. piscicida]|nr:hypothetical protein [Photobacterium damselae]BBC40709.1 hypothetical protein PDPE_1-01549 [Photobacterium damselae subsp. piscicida]
MSDKANGLDVCLCGECGHKHKNESIDLWSICEVCWSQLIPCAELED